MRIISSVTKLHRLTYWLAVFSYTADVVSAGAGKNTALSRATILGVYTLPRVSIAQLDNPACSDAVLEKAHTNGLIFTDLISIGSGLEKVGANEFIGITDRGPNGMAGERRTFPLPPFCPTIVRFRLEADKIVPTQFIPLKDKKGKLVSGISNIEGDERLYETADVKSLLPFDPNGVDLEAIRALPDGKLILSEEYSPSILIVNTNGEILVRYTPASKPLTNATYPVKTILPDVFAQRRLNNGFESLAVSTDQKTAYAILQAPMGDAKNAHYRDSRVVRALKLDLTNPLDARVIGEFLLHTSPAKDYSAKQKQAKIYFSDAAWIAPDKLLLAERGKYMVRLITVDFSHATDILKHKKSGELFFEDTSTDLTAEKIQPAQTTEIFSTREVPEITSDKIEGVAILSPTEIALANDNDFGIGENESGEPSRIWIVRLATPLR